MSGVLGRFWNRLYDGVELANFSSLESVDEGSEIIYVPCHRSHMDYLLLSYVVYHKGFAVPHIAAGINLDLPVIGRFCDAAARSSCVAASRATRSTPRCS